MDKNKEYKIAIGVSGTGTTFEAIAKSVETGKLKMKIAFLFADRNCEAVKKAKNFNIPTLVRQEGEPLNSFHSRVIKKLVSEDVCFVCLAGYLRLFPVSNEDPYLVLNSHPAAIPYFGGKGMWGINVHKKVLSWAKKTDFRYPYTFSTVHVGGEKYDEGSVLGIAPLKINKTDSPETLAACLLPLEHQNYIEVLTKLSENLVQYTEYPEEFLKIIKIPK